MTRRARADRGVAFILVLGVLAGLLILAGPFLAIALNDRDVARSVVYEAEATAVVDTTLRYARWSLERGHRAHEAAAGQPTSGDIYATPDWDVEQEFAVSLAPTDKNGKPLLAADGRPLLGGADPRGRMVDLEVRDAQSRPHLWTSSPFLIAASLGRSTLVADAEADAVELQLESGEGFPLTNGALFVEGERITYEKREGGLFLGLGRAAPPSGKARKHKAETWVIDDRARQIAMLPWKSPRAKGGLRQPHAASAAKEISLVEGGLLTPREIDRLSRDFNTASYRYGGDAFGMAHGLSAPIDPSTVDLAEGFRIRVRGNDGINEGTVLRITDGVNTEYGYVIQARRTRGSNADITLLEPTQNAYVEGRTMVAPLIRHPVNVNACSKETLERVMTGVQITFGAFGRGSQMRVSTIAAGRFASSLVDARPIKEWKEFVEVLDQTNRSWPLLTDGAQTQCILRNAVDAGDHNLGGSTVPFCFASYDYYDVEAAAAINDLSGKERARRRVRELVRIAPHQEQLFRLDSQDDFEEAVLRARLSPYFTTYPNAVERWEPGLLSPGSRIPRWLLYAGQESKTGVFAHKTEGDVRLAPARYEAMWGYAEHFDGQAAGMPDNVASENIDPDGYLLSAGPFTLPLRNPSPGPGGFARAGNGPGGGGGGGGNQARGAIIRGRGPAPIKVDMWMKTGGQGGRRVLYDLAGANPDEQRIQLVVEGDGTVRARVRDRTILDPASGFDETAETVFTPGPAVLRPDTWYHVGMSYRGSKPEDVSLYWDGMKRGQAKYQTLLSRAVSKGDVGFDCDDLNDWPSTGVAWIGREAVEFVRSGNTLTAISYPNGGGTGRGRRGTSDIDHAAGELVQLFGYSTAASSQRNRGGVAIPRGGATLQADLGPFNLASFVGNATENINIPGPGGVPLPIPIEVHDPAKPEGDQLQLIAAPNCPAEFSCFQASGGYAVIVPDFALAGLTGASGGTNSLAPTAELIWYSGRTGNGANATLFGIQSPNLPHFSGSQVTLTGATLTVPGVPNVQLTMSLVRTKHATRFLGGPQGARPLCAVFPISIGITDTAGYFEPMNEDGGGGGIWPEYVSLGQPNYADIGSHRVEWIRYFHIDQGRRHLLCDDLDELGRAVAFTSVNVLTGTQAAVAAPYARANDELRFRGQLGTGIFGYGDPILPQSHGASEDVVPVFRVVQHAGIGMIPPPAGAPAGTPPTAVPPAPAPGWGDSVTVEQAGGTVRRRYGVTWSADADTGLHGLVSFGESTRQEFSQGQLPVGVGNDRDTYTRLLKFPSGELPAIGRGARGRAGGDVDGTTGAEKIDEFRVSPLSEERYVVWDHAAMGLNASGTNQATGSTTAGVTETATEIPLCNVDWVINLPTTGNTYVVLPDGRQVHHSDALLGFPQNDAFLVQIDDEVIAARQIGTGRGGGPALLDCERGFMGTVATRHGFGANVVFLEHLPVTMLQQALAATDRDVTVADDDDFANTGGLLLIDNELLHYTEIFGGRLRMPPALDDRGAETGGLLRGRFGTPASAHDTQSIVLDMPFRHWDRYADRQDNPEIGFYGFGIHEPGALFSTFAYEELRPNPNVRFVALLRTEPDQRWNGAPGTGGLWKFDEPAPLERPHRLDRRGSFLEGRFLVRYESGSFDPVTQAQHEWKSTPELRSLQVTFRNATQVLSRESSK